MRSRAQKFRSKTAALWAPNKVRRRSSVFGSHARVAAQLRQRYLYPSFLSKPVPSVLCFILFVPFLVFSPHGLPLMHRASLPVVIRRSPSRAASSMRSCRRGRPSRAYLSRGSNFLLPLLRRSAFDTLHFPFLCARAIHRMDA